MAQNYMTPECNTTQGFGGNATATYKAGGLLGHTAIDNDCGYGTPIHSYWDSEYVYKVLDAQHPSNDGSGFTGVFTIVEQDGRCFEFLYGHGNPSVVVGQILTKGTVVGTQANNGEVYEGGMRITLEMQKSGDHRGSHRHDQARLLKKVSVYDPTLQYISAPTGEAFFKDGYFYSIPDYSNGYRGCYDWTKTPTTIIKPPAIDTPFQAFQKALTAFQTSEVIKPYPLVGNLTKKALNKYLTDIKY